LTAALAIIDGSVAQAAGVTRAAEQPRQLATTSTPRPNTTEANHTSHSE